MVAALNREKFLEFNSAEDVAGNTIKYEEDLIFLDPPYKDLGARLIINLEKLYLSLKKLELKDSKIKEYYKLSHTLGIPQNDLNKLQNKLFGIECNFEELNGIDFKKGCYVGQENTARIKLLKKLSKRLMPIQLIKGELSIDQIIKDENNIEVGKILIDGDYSFGLIKCVNNNFNFHKPYSSYAAKIKILKTNWV